MIKKVVLTATLMFLLTPGNAYGLTSRQELNQIEGQINNVTSSINKKRAEKDSLAKEAAIIEGQIAQTDLALRASNLKISILTNEINVTTGKITEVTSQLKKEQVKMSEYLSVIYEEGNTSLLEQIFSARTFSDFIDQKEYLVATQLKLKETADKISALKKELESKKAELAEKKKITENLKISQEAQRAAQATQKAYKDSIIAAIATEEQGLQSQLNDLHARKAALSAAYGESFISGTSGYPYGNPPPRRIIDTPDPWGYLIGECTSFAAWKRTTIGNPIPRGLGNANTWGTRAAGMGLSVTSTPRVGDVMVMPYVGRYGHVAYVEAVYGPGKILISEYNWTPFSYSTRIVNPYNYSAQFIH